jgi:hypothetical protein
MVVVRAYLPRRRTVKAEQCRWSCRRHHRERYRGAAVAVLQNGGEGRWRAPIGPHLDGASPWGVQRTGAHSGRATKARRGATGLWLLRATAPTTTTTVADALSTSGHAL